MFQLPVVMSYPANVEERSPVESESALNSPETPYTDLQKRYMTYPGKVWEDIRKGKGKRYMPTKYGKVWEDIRKGKRYMTYPGKVFEDIRKSSARANGGSPSSRNNSQRHHYMRPGK